MPPPRNNNNSSAGGSSNRFFRRKRTCKFSAIDAPPIDYKDVNTLKQFVTENGKIIPARLTGTRTRYQRQLTTAIKRARYLSLMPYTDKHE